MVSFVLVTRMLGSDHAHILPGGDWYAGAVTALSGTHFTDYGPSAPVLSVQVGRREVDMSVLNGFPDSQQFSVACTPCRVPGRWLFCWIVTLCVSSVSFGWVESSRPFTLLPLVLSRRLFMGIPTRRL